MTENFHFSMNRNHPLQLSSDHITTMKTKIKIQENRGMAEISLPEIA